MSVVFYWIGAGVTGLVLLAVVLFALAWLYFRLIDGRLKLILFRKGTRDMSIAVWHPSRLIIKDEDPASLEHWHADDWPVARRPFLISYRVQKRTFFVLAGIMKPVRNDVIEGTHPCPR